jgi:hypothetical protein
MLELLLLLNILAAAVALVFLPFILPTLLLDKLAASRKAKAKAARAGSSAASTAP